MRRRLDLAACLVVPRPVVFLDEPTTGLDPASRQDMWGAVEGLVADGVALVLTTQYLEEADRLADQIVVLSEGRTVAAGTPAELKARVGERRVHLTLPDADALQERRARCSSGSTPSSTCARAACPSPRPRARRTCARRSTRSRTPASRSTRPRSASRRSTTRSSPSPTGPRREGGRPR